jgi:hypothetical protein
MAHQRSIPATAITATPSADLFAALNQLPAFQTFNQRRPMHEGRRPKAPKTSPTRGINLCCQKLFRPHTAKVQQRHEVQKPARDFAQAGL